MSTSQDISKDQSQSRAAKAMQIVNRLSALTSTVSGADAALMVPQYSAPIVIYLLLKLARLRAFRFQLSPARQQSIVAFARGLGAGAAGLSEARTIMRFFGLLPMIQWLLALHPKPLVALRSFLLAPHKLDLLSAKSITTIQCLSLMVYYPLEHLGWLSGKGIVPLSAGRTGQAVVWSVRAWAIYVLLDIYKLSRAYVPLQKRTRAIRLAKPTISAAEAEGYELQPSSATEPGSDSALEKTSSEISPSTDVTTEKDSLRKDWHQWRLAVIKNIGYGPLTIHWSFGGLWSEPAITGLLGSLAAGSKFISAWEAVGA